MNSKDAVGHGAEAELLILPNGTLLVHNLTPAAAAVLAELDPANSVMLQRAASWSQLPAPHLAPGLEPVRSPGAATEAGENQAAQPQGP